MCRLPVPSLIEGPTMIVHLVLFKLKSGVSRNDPRLREAITMLEAVKGKVPGVQRWECGWNFSDRPIAYDYGLSSTFATREDLAIYVPHPEHQAAVTKLREVADWVLCDYEVNEQR